MEDYDLNEEEDGVDLVVDSWKKVLSRRNGKIWWEDMWKLDIEGRAYEPEPEAEEEQPAEPENVYLKDQVQQMMVMMKSMQEGFHDQVNQKFGELNKRMCAVEQYINGNLNEESMGFQFNDYWRGSHRMNNFETSGTSGGAAGVGGGGGADENVSAKETVSKPHDAAAVAAEKTVSEAPYSLNAGQDEVVKKTVPQAEYTGLDAAEKTVSESLDTPNTGQDEAMEETVPIAGHDVVEKMAEPYGHSIINGKRVKQLDMQKKTPRPKRMTKILSVCLTPFVPK